MRSDAERLAELTEIIGGLMKIGSAETFVETVWELIEAEREECAAIAERGFDQPGDPEFDIPVDVARKIIAAAIRARGGTPA